MNQLSHVLLNSVRVASPQTCCETQFFDVKSKKAVEDTRNNLDNNNTRWTSASTKSVKPNIILMKGRGGEGGKGRGGDGSRGCAPKVEGNLLGAHEKFRTTQCW